MPWFLLSVDALFANRREYGNQSVRLPVPGRQITLWNSNTMRFDRYKVVLRSQRHDAFVVKRVSPVPSCACRRCRKTFTKPDTEASVRLPEYKPLLSTPDWVARRALAHFRNVVTISKAY